MADPMNLPDVPFPLVSPAAQAWVVDDATGRLEGTAGPRTDHFVDPGGGPAVNAESMLNAPTLLGLPPVGDFRFSAKVTVDFRSTFDAGVLMLWAGERRWAKLCFEFSPAGEPMIVSVVTREVSDDANAFVVAGRTAWLRVSRIDNAYAYHASTDGTTWSLIRFFALDAGTHADRLGFEVQSPTGEGCRAVFEEITFSTERLADLRDGS